MDERMGPMAPAPGAPEREVLRRFRAYAASALHRGGELSAPALDGLRAQEQRASALLDCWMESATQVAGKRAPEVRDALTPLIREFRTALRNSAPVRSQRGTPRSRRRAVMAAIDRITDVFLAVDANTARIADANPAAGALLGVQRNALLGRDLLSFVPREHHAGWWTELDAVCEGTEPRRFQSELHDARQDPIPVECSVTRFVTQKRPLALVVARPSTAFPEAGSRPTRRADENNRSEGTERGQGG